MVTCRLFSGITLAWAIGDWQNATTGNSNKQALETSFKPLQIIYAI